jgi:hypothetical protein
VADKTFDVGAAELLAWVGTDDLTGHVVVDQVYAHFQHEAADLIAVPYGNHKPGYREFTRVLTHDHGGGPNYLGGPLYANLDRYMAVLAASILPEGNETPTDAMMDCMQDLAGIGGVASHAPLYFGTLRESGHPFVTEDGVTTRDQPPLAPRKSDLQVNADWTLPDGEWRWD